MPVQKSLETYWIHHVILTKAMYIYFMLLGKVWIYLFFFQLRLK